MVRRCNDHCRLRIHVADPGGCVCDAGGGVAPVWLCEDVLWRKRRQMPVHQVGIGRRGDYEDIFLGNYSEETVVCELYETLADAQDIEKLFGHVISAYGPETAAHSAGHDYAIEIIVHLM